MKLILGSQSPRRKEILGYFSIPFDQVASSFDEDSISFSGDPEKYVMDLSKCKSECLVNKFPDSIVLTADTIVFRAGKIYGKPKNEHHAYQSLLELSGQWHSVYTGVTIQKGNKVHTGVEVTQVLFNELTPDQMNQYITSNEGTDKAGGYAIQGKGGLIVHKIEGCYYNVMGLPINTVERLLKYFRIELWNYL